MPVSKLPLHLVFEMYLSKKKQFFQVIVINN